MRPLFADPLALDRPDDLPGWPQAPAAPRPAPATRPAVPTQRRPVDRAVASPVPEAQRLHRTAD